MTNESEFARAERLLVGGVNSPVRAFRSVGGVPVFMERGSGPFLFDCEGRKYVDFLGAWGPMILGHADADVVAAVKQAAEGSFSFGTPSPAESDLAELVIERYPSIEKIRFVNSGTEATMSALRLARGFTGRSKIMKFAGGYHGHADYLLVKAGSGATTLGTPDSAGVPPAFAAETIVARYNDLDDVLRLARADAKTLAAIIVEPVAGNMGVVPPLPGFLEGLRKLCDEVGALLVFDEVMCGFRVARGGAQELYGVWPDLTCLGKILGGGLPVGAYGGRAEIMDRVSPLGPVYQAGTNSGNPVAMAAGIATVKKLTPEFYARLERTSARLADGLSRIFDESAVVQRVGSMMTLFFIKDGERRVTSYDDAPRVDTRRYAEFFTRMLAGGIHLPPSAFEALFVSGAHTDEAIDRFLDLAAAG